MHLLFKDINVQKVSFFIHCIYVLSNLVRHDHFCKFKNILEEFRIFKT